MFEHALKGLLIYAPLSEVFTFRCAVFRMHANTKTRVL